ncbi:hypothetical protein V9T40_001145 [Parthenolecanium corni]|uniref:Uncharacterized protein n=1 Tax=Parthenolecanium corni TaxID=536013 RepID=A0AAN9TRT8_9HEMI
MSMSDHLRIGQGHSNNIDSTGKRVSPPPAPSRSPPPHVVASPLLLPPPLLGRGSLLVISRRVVLILRTSLPPTSLSAVTARLSAFLIKLSAFGLPVFPSKINGFRLLAFGFQLASELWSQQQKKYKNHHQLEAQRKYTADGAGAAVECGMTFKFLANYYQELFPVTFLLAPKQTNCLPGKASEQLPGIFCPVLAQDYQSCHSSPPPFYCLCSSTALSRIVFTSTFAASRKPANLMQSTTASDDLYTVISYKRSEPKQVKSTMNNKNRATTQ